jgi:hypothetical protein
MKRITFLFSLMMALLLASTSAVAAQSADPDVDAIGESVLAVEPEALVDALGATPDDSVLPDGFINPESGTPENEDLIAAFSSPIGDLDGAVGTVTHGLDTDPDVVPGLISSGIITYIVADEEITDDDVADFEDGARESMEGNTDPSVEASVESVEVAGVDSVQIEVVTTQGDIVSVVQMVAIPVGNTFVIGTVVVADQAEVDEAEVLEFANEVGIAGVENLGIVAEDAG